ncbi:MAG: hypothetical protein KAV00_11870 [Phycisphaerae bacterium]|nr:hypothetical protein [Phycisphaerae bacterium]
MRVLVGLILLLGLMSSCDKKDNSSDAKVPEHLKNVTPIPDIDAETLLPGQEAIVRECDSILASLQAGGVKAAFKKIRELSPLPDSELDLIEKKTQQQLDALRPRFGKIIGFERVRIEVKGQSVMECIYIAKCEKHILRWRFYFYKPKDKWFLNTFYWDGNINEL